MTWQPSVYFENTHFSVELRTYIEGLRSQFSSHCTHIHYRAAYLYDMPDFTIQRKFHPHILLHTHTHIYLQHLINVIYHPIPTISTPSNPIQGGGSRRTRRAKQTRPHVHLGPCERPSHRPVLPDHCFLPVGPRRHHHYPRYHPPQARRYSLLTMDIKHWQRSPPSLLEWKPPHPRWGSSPARPGAVRDVGQPVGECDGSAWQCW